jgi:hypothetical protein
LRTGLEPLNVSGCFDDVRSRTQFAGSLDSGHAALRLIGVDGRLLSTYNWTGK